jgi:hypothetical protein
MNWTYVQQILTAFILDIQGAKFLALQGATELLKHIEAIAHHHKLA